MAGITRPVAKSLSGAVHLAVGASRTSFVLMIGLTIVSAATAPAVVDVSRHFVNLITLGVHQNQASIIRTAALLGVLAFLQRWATSLQGNRAIVYGRRLTQHAQQRFLAQTSTVPLGSFDAPEWHDRLARASQSINFRPNLLAQTLLEVTGAGVTLAGMLLILLSLNPLLLALAVVAVLPTLMVQRRINDRVHDTFVEMTAQDREKVYLGELLTEPGAAKEIRANALSTHFLTRHAELEEAIGRRFRSAVGFADKAGLVANAWYAAGLFAAYLFVGTHLAAQSGPGDVVAVIAAFTAVNAQLSTIVSQLTALDQHSALFLDDYHSFLQLPNEDDEAARRRSTVTIPRDRAKSFEEGRGDRPAVDGPTIVFDRVTFAYPGQSEPALCDVSVTLRPGRLTGLVGENGAGKSTFVRLLLGFYVPDSGGIYLDGVEVRSIELKDLRSRIGVLFQDFVNYELSLRENVALGRVDRNGDDTQIHAALRAARAEGLVAGLDEGLDSRVGRLFHGGHDLSGGQWQRLALSRLMYRDADMWILDEPTSALDPLVEAQIFAELQQRLGRRTGLIITHRFGNVRSADQIVVFSGGRISEIGDHDSLMASEGSYAHLFELQAASYR